MNLFKALSYKEWIKTRKMTGMLFLVSLAVLSYSFIEVTHSIRLDDAIKVWYGFLFLNNGLPGITLFFPAIAGITFALVQFVPEMVNKRLKLTLHLPAKESSIISAMLIYGYLVLFGIFFASVVIYMIGLSSIFTYEITTVLMSKLLPSFVSGLVAYGLTAWICFEPQWKQRVLNSFVAIGLLSILFVSQMWGVYFHFGIGLIVLLIASFVLPFYSVLRFKHGVL